MSLIEAQREVSESEAQAAFEWRQSDRRQPKEYHIEAALRERLTEALAEVMPLKALEDGVRDARHQIRTLSDDHPEFESEIADASSMHEDLDTWPEHVVDLINALAEKVENQRAEIERLSGEEKPEVRLVKPAVRRPRALGATTMMLPLLGVSEETEKGEVKGEEKPKRGRKKAVAK